MTQNVELTLIKAPAGGWTVSNAAGLVAAFSSIHEVGVWLGQTYPETGDDEMRGLAERHPPQLPADAAGHDPKVTPLREKAAGILPWGR